MTNATKQLLQKHFDSSLHYVYAADGVTVIGTELRYWWLGTPPVNGKMSGLEALRALVEYRPEVVVDDRPAGLVDHELAASQRDHHDPDELERNTAHTLYLRRRQR